MNYPQAVVLALIRNGVIARCDGSIKVFPSMDEVRATSKLFHPAWDVGTYMPHGHC